MADLNLKVQNFICQCTVAVSAFQSEPLHVFRSYLNCTGDTGLARMSGEKGVKFMKAL